MSWSDGQAYVLTHDFVHVVVVDVLCASAAHESNNHSWRPQLAWANFLITEKIKTRDSSPNEALLHRHWTPMKYSSLQSPTHRRGES